VGNAHAWDVSCFKPFSTSRARGRTWTEKWGLHNGTGLVQPGANHLTFRKFNTREDQSVKRITSTPLATSIDRRAFVRSSTAIAAGLALLAANVGRAKAATLKLKFSSSLPNDPKYSNGRVYYDNLVKNLKANELGEQIEVALFPDNQLGQEIDVINSRRRWTKRRCRRCSRI
jgi:hypothetical protein